MDLSVVRPEPWGRDGFWLPPAVLREVAMFRATVHTFSIRALVLVGLMAIAMLASTAVPSLGSSNTWTTTGMTTARTGHAATLLANGEVLVAGGLSNGGSPIGTSCTSTAEL